MSGIDGLPSRDLVAKSNIQNREYSQCSFHSVTLHSDMNVEKIKELK